MKTKLTIFFIFTLFLLPSTLNSYGLRFGIISAIKEKTKELKEKKEEAQSVISIQENKIWVRQSGTSAADVSLGVTADGLGNIYVTGWTSGGLDGNVSAGGQDIFLIKYDTNGNKIWTRQSGTSAADVSWGVSADSSGNIYVTGSTYGGFDGNISAGGEDIFLIKYDSNGNKIWTRQSGTSAGDGGEGVSADGSGNIYVTGWTSGGLDGNTNAGGADIFLIKYDTNGNKIWTRQSGTSDYDVSRGVSADGSGNIYVTGSTYGGLDGNVSAGWEDIFLIKYDSNGNKIWTRQSGTSAGDGGEGVSADGSGNIYVSGGTSGGLDGNVSAGDDDIFLIKYDTNGNKIWTRQIGTSAADESRGVSADGSGNIYVSGWTNGGLDGNTNAGDADFFLIKYD